MFNIHWDNNLFSQKTFDCYADAWLGLCDTTDYPLNLFDFAILKTQECFLDL